MEFLVGTILNSLGLINAIDPSIILNLGRAPGLSTYVSLDGYSDL